MCVFCCVCVFCCCVIVALFESLWEIARFLLVFSRKKFCEQSMQTFNANTNDEKGEWQKSRSPTIVVLIVVASLFLPNGQSREALVQRRSAVGISGCPFQASPSSGIIETRVNRRLSEEKE